jgi:hypothetical protein
VNRVPIQLALYQHISSPNPLPDSERARFRLARLFESITGGGSFSQGELRYFLETELGVNVDISSPARLFKNVHIAELLDYITLVHRFCAKRWPQQAARWQAEAQRIFSEERLAYEIDGDCIVHPAVDPEFQRNRQATIAALQLPRYANSLASFQRVSDQLALQPPNGKEAWRAVFAAVEGLFRLMFSRAPQLNAGAVDTHLEKLLQQIHASDPVALRAAMKQAASFKNWVDSSHNYRHEPGSEEPVQPPIDLAVLAISNGAGFLRWLITLDQSMTALAPAGTAAARPTS